MNNLKILSKLHSIQSEIEKMEKDGKNQHQNYAYLSETQITIKMKSLLDKHKVVFLYGSQITDVQTWENAKGVKQFLTTVQVSYEFVDVESGERITSSAVGQGADTGDKGVYKAITGAIKYIYMKTFNIPTGDDPEKDTDSYAPVKSAKAVKPVIDDIPDPTEEWPDAKKSHYCELHKTNLKERYGGVWDHREQKNGLWYHCQGQGWRLSTTQQK